jgi:Bacterial regulatory proteins, tetR family
VKKSGAVAGISVTPSLRRWSWPASCTARSRANRSGFSTMIERTPLLAIRSSIAAPHGLVVEPIDDDHPSRLGIALDWRQARRAPDVKKRNRLVQTVERARSRRAVKLVKRGFAVNAGSKMRPRSKSGRKLTQGERRENAERRILDAATRLVADKGLDAFTLADVGEAAGFSSGLPAHYFKTKDGLLAAVVERIRQQHFFGILGLKESERGLEDLFAATALYFQSSAARSCCESS